MAAVFYERVMEAANKEAFVAGFEEILNREIEGISKALDNVYPRPDPVLKQVCDQMVYSSGSLGGLKLLLQAFREANAQVGADEQLTPEHLDVLIKIAYQQIASELENIRTSICDLSKQARNNKLFISLD